MVVDRGGPSIGDIPSTRITTSNIHTTDLTQRFRDAALRLPVGTLVKDEYFTLFEAVGALEIGDPKMDSGCLDDREDMNHEYDIHHELLPEEAMWLMDELLSREVAWQMGYPLSQTLFTSVYIDNILWPNPVHLSEAQFTGGSRGADDNGLLHTCFRGYCLGLIKCCDLVLDMVTSQHYYEEEDFATQLFNRELLHRISPSDVLMEMQHSLQWIDAASIQEDTKKELRTRLQFRHMLLQTLATHVTGGHVDTRDIVNMLVKIQTSPIEGAPVRNAFSPKIQRQLASTVPPRPMIVMDKTMTFAFWKQSLNDMSDVFCLSRTTHGSDLFTSLLALNHQRPQPSAYVRALLQSFLTRDEKVCGHVDPAKYLANDLCSIISPGSLLRRSIANDTSLCGEKSRAISDHLVPFISKIERSYINMFRSLSLNRCRMRRTLCHAASEFDQIQAEAEELDEEVQNISDEEPSVYQPGTSPTYSYSISSWIYHYKLIQLRLVIQTGFELSIYAPYELPGMYWYLSHISSTHLAHLERMAHFLSSPKSLQPGASRLDTTISNEVLEAQQAQQLLYAHYSLLKGTESLAKALQFLYTVLRRRGQFPPPRSTYATDDMRYEIRMKPFLYLSIPEPIQFDDFQRLSQTDEADDLVVLEQAALAASTAKKSWEAVLRSRWHIFPLQDSITEADVPDIVGKLRETDVRGALRATISASIAINSLKKRLLKPKNIESSTAIDAQIPQLGDGDFWHSWWLVPRIKL